MSFAQILNKFIKSESAKNSELEEETPILKGDIAEEESDAMPDSEGGSDTVDIYDKLSQALDSGEVSADRESIISWGSSNGLSQEEAEDLADVVLTGIEEDGGEDPDQPSLFEGDGDGDEYEDEESMAKSVIKYLQTVNEEIRQIKESTQTKLSDMEKENSFLKSEVKRLGGLPVDEKSPMTNIEDVKTSGSSRLEVIQKITKGVLDKELDMYDLQVYENTNGFTKNVKKYFEKAGK